MRNILVEQARRKAGPKAGGGRARVDLDAAEAQTPEIQPTHEPALGGNLLALNNALTKLRELDERKAEVVMLKFFAGLDHEAIADALGTSVPTVERDWRFVRSWLAREMGREGV
jgi:RNA polymerase sigma factor (TIGR02999 family)